MLMIEKTTVVNLAQLLPTSPGLSVTKAPAVVRSPSEEARALEARQTQRRAKIGVRYKTKNCHTFAESGECKYGEACVFAHGEEELAKYIAIAEAAEAITDVVSVAGPPPQTETAPPASNKKTKTASQVVPAVGSKGSVTPQTAPSKYRDALMKSVPSVAPSTPTASKKQRRKQQPKEEDACAPAAALLNFTPILNTAAAPKRCDSSIYEVPSIQGHSDSPASNNSLSEPHYAAAGGDDVLATTTANDEDDCSSTNDAASTCASPSTLGRNVSPARPSARFSHNPYARY